ncbi:MAG TPA: hypothetical protein VJM08_09355 [Anaerolineales bacterium]|nr:hypothetical protein [Anaerolineales bacterium]
MGKYSTVQKRAPIPRNRGVHPVMRGIGCIMMIIVPILAYGSAVLLVNYGVSQGWPIPPGWLGTPTFHPLLWRLQGLTSVLTFLQAQTNLIANLVFAIAITVVIGGIMSIIYGYIYTIFGPPQYGPTDVPPERIKVKKYTR